VVVDVSLAIVTFLHYTPYPKKCTAIPLGYCRGLGDARSDWTMLARTAEVYFFKCLFFLIVSRSMKVKKGRLIQLRAWGNRLIFRRFVGEQNGTVLICSDHEYKSALREKREPLCVGFPLADVVGASTRENLRLQFRRNQSGTSARAGRATQQ
jgi:hypothetical protein